MEFKLETLPQYRLAYVRQTGPYGPGNLQAMGKLKEWAQERQLLTESAILLGIPQDNPQTTPPENCRYDACIVIPSDLTLDQPIVGEHVFNGGNYVIYTVKHTAEDIQQAWHTIPAHLHSSGFILDNRPIVERYAGDMLLNDYCEICVPVADVH
ncbi:AraC family transcriptional regulator [Paenibacillus kobensis]|uniref:AraC family transcriptional regulator n=1 Tax=Paenibacillus kobensis TaxID=59841 RepID=UPI000FD7F741|nr:GyrI-like domain-containing protein [Paenibacillus kobensis]